MLKIYGVVKVRKSGGSLVVIIPKDAAEEKGIKESDSMVVSPSDGGLVYERQEA